MTERVLCIGAGLRPDVRLTAIARELAGPEGAVAAVTVPSDDTDPSRLPVERIYSATTSGVDVARGDHVGAVVAAATRAFGATVVISGPVKVNREGLARAGALLGGPVLTGVRSPRVTAEGVEVSRDLLSGNATAIEHTSTRPVFLSMAEDIDTPTGPQGVTSGAMPETIPLSVELPAYHFRTLSLQPKPARSVDLETAERIVSVGRGLQRKADLPLVENLAVALGAVVGCTRPIAADSGWLSDDHWVGLTGHRVRPSLYVAVGISGAAQHLVGMRDSKIVVAINKDPNAPIFQQADYQVVGDLYAILPELTRALLAAKLSS